MTGHAFYLDYILDCFSNYEQLFPRQDLFVFEEKPNNIIKPNKTRKLNTCGEATNRYELLTSGGPTGSASPSPVA